MSTVALPLRGLPRPALAWTLAGAVVALEVPYPLVHGSSRNVLTVAAVVVFCGASTVHAATTRSWRHALGLLAVAAGTGFVAETVGLHTGVPFGRYHYTGGLGPSLLGVPLVVPLAWAMMAHPAHAVAARLSPAAPARVAIGALALASWDVFLDPQMVAAGHWRWAAPSPHLPGIADVPLTNFAGWLAVSVVLLAAVVAIERDAPAHPHEDGPAIALWVWSWWSSVLADLAFLHRPAVAGWGALAMGCIGVPLLVRLVRLR